MLKAIARAAAPGRARLSDSASCEPGAGRPVGAAEKGVCASRPVWAGVFVFGVGCVCVLLGVVIVDRLSLPLSVRGRGGLFELSD